MYLFAVTVVSGVIMFTLFMSELNYYLTKDIQQELFVDTSRGQKLTINIDITLMKVGCMCKRLFCIKLYPDFCLVLVNNYVPRKWCLQCFHLFLHQRYMVLLSFDLYL